MTAPASQPLPGESRPCWEAVTDAAQAEARHRQAALLPALERWDNSLATHEELEQAAANAYALRNGSTVDVRTVRRWIRDAIDRDAGRRDWSRPELFLRRNPPLRPQHSAQLTAIEQPFASLFDVISDLATPGEPTPEEEALLWLRAWQIHGAQVASGMKPKTSKAELLRFLSRHSAWLTSGQSREALRVMVARQFRKHAHAEQAGKSIAEAALDGRVARHGVAVAPPIPVEDIEKVVAYALFNCNGRLAQAERELVDLREGSGISAATLDLMDAGESKSYVNRRLAQAARPQLDMCAPYLLGKKAVDDATPSLQRDYSKLRSMQVVTADDFTMPVYFHVPDGKGGFELTRGQVLLFVDVRSLKIITWVLIPARNYDSLHIRTAMNTVCLEQGRPDVWYFERGLWQRSNLVKGRPPKEWRLAHDSEAESEYGWEKLGVRFIHATRARSKPGVERVGGLLQNLMERCRGYCGRNERVDCPEETRKAILAVQARRVPPQEHFYSFDEWHVELGRLIERYNADRQQGRILQGRSPNEAFEEFWPHANPPVKFDPSCWHLCAHYVSERDVTVDGITFNVGQPEVYLLRRKPCRSAPSQGARVLRSRTSGNCGSH